TKHFSLGIFVEPNIKINSAVSLRTKTYLEYQFPANETRFFLKEKNPVDFDEKKFKKDVHNAKAAAQDVVFYQDQIINTFFPDPFRTLISPGFTFQLTTGPSFRVRNWDFSFGYDFWIQQKEKIDY